jgi:hypothetical protein
MASNRPPDSLIAAAIVLFTIWSHRRRALWLLAGAAVPLALLMCYNLEFIGHIVGGYALGKYPDKKFFQLDWTGLPGLLISPSRGLLVFSPFLVFLPVGLILRLREPGTRGLAVTLSLAVAAQFLLYSQADWRAGVSWGPRWLTDFLPILVWILAAALLVLRPFARGLLIAAMAGCRCLRPPANISRKPAHLYSGLWVARKPGRAWHSSKGSTLECTSVALACRVIFASTQTL